MIIDSKTKHYIKLGKHYAHIKKKMSNGTKKGMMLAKIKGKRIGRKPKYDLNDSRVQFALRQFITRKTSGFSNKYGRISPTKNIKNTSELTKIPVSTIYRLAHKYLKFRGNQK